MRTFMHAPLAALVCALGSAAIAGDFDGSKPLLCAPVEGIECHAGQGCEQGLPDDVGAPAFMRIDFAKQAIVGPKSTSTIRFMDKLEGRSLLQGTELGFAWSMALNAEDGKFALTLVDHNGTFILYGACTTY